MCIRDRCLTIWEHVDLLVKGGQVGRRENRASVAPQAAASAVLFLCGSTAWTESDLGVHGENMLVLFSKEPTAQLERRKGTPVPSDQTEDSL